MGTGQVEEALGFLEKELANPRLRTLLFYEKVGALSRLKRFPEAEALILQRIGTGKANGRDYNSLAWNQVVPRSHCQELSSRRGSLRRHSPWQTAIPCTPWHSPAELEPHRRGARDHHQGHHLAGGEFAQARGRVRLWPHRRMAR